MTVRRLYVFVIAAILPLCGCHRANTPSPIPSPPSSPNAIAQAANRQFLQQKAFDPWLLTNTDPQNPIPAYLGSGASGYLIASSSGKTTQQFQAGHYVNGQLAPVPVPAQNHPLPQGGIPPASSYQQTLDLRSGLLTTRFKSGPGLSVSGGNAGLRHIWQTADIVIDGDPEAQQVTHANLFYLLCSTYPGSDHSIPPMGLSSNAYGGHIFWDADVWMLPALIVQHPEYAKPIVDYRFKTLAQARKNAQAHGFKGAEYPWESADTGAEMAPAEFARERHITADVGFAAWQYYLWTGDRHYLQGEAWPILQATAQYWASRVTKGADGKYHIKGVLSPDETAGAVDDDTYTNAVVRYNLRAAPAAARLLGQTPDPRWTAIADALYFPFDQARRIPAENNKPMTDRFAAKQADTLLLIHPLGVSFDPATAGRMLDFYSSHTIKTGPAMTSSIHAVVAAKLGRARQSLEMFRDSYRPFVRAPWDAFSEKRTTNNVYFLTGMAGCLQSVLYGFAGLQVHPAGEAGGGTKLAGDAEAALYADPHLPPGWGKLVIKGIKFRGKTMDLTISPGNKVAVKSQ